MRAGPDLRGPDVVVPLPRGRDPGAGRLRDDLGGRHPGGRQPGPRRRGARIRQPLRAPGGGRLPGRARERAGAHLHLPPLELRPRREPARHPVLARDPRRGWDGRRLRHEPALPAQGPGRDFRRGGVRDLLGRDGAARGLPRPVDAGPHRAADVPADPHPRPSAPAHRRQLEALSREPARHLPREPAARVPRHLRPRPGDPAGRGRDGCAPPAQPHLRPCGERPRRGRPGRLWPAARARERAHLARSAPPRVSPRVRGRPQSRDLDRVSERRVPAAQQLARDPPGPDEGHRRLRPRLDVLRLRGRRRGHDRPPPAPVEPLRPRGTRLHGRRGGDRDRPPREPARRWDDGHRGRRQGRDLRSRIPGERRAGPRLLVLLCGADGHRAAGAVR